ncbi:MAG: T9SS type A sorting domain-containing protein [Flavobacteriales bacterium]|nr:T9SS type A sorting domain-containing protein [Flavobacteriales bacterium]MCB9174814.1 T9SS type A sorting domain-containing protein [Flavobacteriales bacterium]
MKNLLLILFIFLTTLAFSQARMVINDNGYLVIDNGAYLVIDNPATNALATAGTGGNIKSEAETDRIKWNIAATTGTYTIPWTTNSGVKIPLSINKTTAGTIGANSGLLLSTWETTDMNLPWPSAVSNMWQSTAPATNGSLNVVDRFWHINALSYTAKPNVTLSFTYNNTPGVEIGGTNTITESRLQAQRFNTGSSNWEAYKLFGTVNVGARTVSGAAIASADFFENWVLVDNANPLPVTLSNFSSTCSDKEIIVTWTTQTEINNDYFVLEKSYDGYLFFESSVIDGAGTSSVSNTYHTNVTAENRVIYFRLKQVDFDGTVSYSDVIASSCTNASFDVVQLTLSSSVLSFIINSSVEDNFQVYLYDYRGRLILNQNQLVEKGLNTINFSNLQLSSGIYMLSIVGKENVYNTKLYRR